MLLFAWLACTGGSDGDGIFRPRKDDGGDDTGQSSGDDTDDGGPDKEEICDDGLDDDGDGQTDCDDSDCDSFKICTLPEVIDHRSLFDFTGRRVTCETWAGDFEEDVDDCVTDFTSALEMVTEGDLCEPCDATYEGAFDYSQDTCTAAFGDGSSPPASGRFGFAFVNDDKWVLFGKNETTGTWEEGVTLSRDGERYVWQTTEPVSVDVDDCDNSPLHVGDVTVTLSFTPR